MWNLINFSPVVPFYCITRVHAHLGITFCLTSCKSGVNAKYSCAWPRENEKPPQSERRKNNTPAYHPKGKFYKRLWTERSSSHNITYFHKRIRTATATELAGGEPPAESTPDLSSLPSRGDERLTPLPPRQQRHPHRGKTRSETQTSPIGGSALVQISAAPAELLLAQLCGSRVTLCPRARRHSCASTSSPCRPGAKLRGGYNQICQVWRFLLRLPNVTFSYGLMTGGLDSCAAHAVGYRLPRAEETWTRPGTRQHLLYLSIKYTK